MSRLWISTQRVHVLLKRSCYPGKAHASGLYGCWSSTDPKPGRPTAAMLRREMGPAWGASRDKTPGPPHGELGTEASPPAHGIARGGAQPARPPQHLARCHNTLRRRMSRRGRAPLSFAKKLAPRTSVRSSLASATLISREPQDQPALCSTTAFLVFIHHLSMY